MFVVVVRLGGVVAVAILVLGSIDGDSNSGGVVGGVVVLVLVLATIVVISSCIFLDFERMSL